MESDSSSPKKKKKNLHIQKGEKGLKFEKKHQNCYEMPIFPPKNKKGGRLFNKKF